MSWNSKNSLVDVADSPLDKNADGVSHEFVGHLQDLVRQGGTDQNHLSCRRQVTVDIIDLLLKP